MWRVWSTLSDVKDIIQKDFSSADGEGYIVLPPQVLHAGMFESRIMRVMGIFIEWSVYPKAAALKALQAEEVPAKYNPYPPTPIVHPISTQDPSRIGLHARRFAALKEPHIRSIT